MTIRKRLASFIFVMMGLLVFLGGLLIVGGPIILGAFSQSLSSMDSLNSIRQLRSSLIQQRTSLNRYLLLDDSSELISFEEAARQGSKIIDELKIDRNHGALEWLEPFAKDYEETQLKSRMVTTLYKKGDKIHAYEQATGIFEKVVNQITTLEKENGEEAQRMFRRIHGVINHVKNGVLLALAFAVFVGVLLFRSLYRSVMKPLEVLRRGTEEFGQGNWSNRIELSSDNEFGALAESFNTMAQNVKQFQMQAVHMDRMSAVGQLAGGVAHEINNPLTAVLGQAQILMAKMPQTDPSYAQLAKIENAALRCKKIVRGLLDFSRPNQSTFEDINANDVLLATLDLCEADLKKAKVTVEKKFGKNLPGIQGSSSELQQVLLNLVNNAIQAMPRGGTLTIDSHVTNEPITLVERRKGMGPRKIAGPWVEIVVRDTGVGIVKDHLSRVFEPFFTTKEIGKGTGLGLAVSMGIIQKHGGDLRVASDGVNKGATFHVLLPIKSTESIRTGIAA